MKKFIAFTATWLLLLANFGSCLDFQVIGDAIITEANHDAESSPSLENHQDQGSQVTSNENGGDATTGGPAVVGNGSDIQSSPSPPPPPPPIPSEISEQWTTAYPWLASIYQGKKQICTGTLINKEYILTTAFCLYDLDSADLAGVEVRIGFSSVPIVKSRQSERNHGPMVTSKVKRSLRHLRFSPSTGFNDIALIQLGTSIKPDQGVGPIQLENVTAMESDTEIQHVIGWRDGIDLTGDTVQYWRDQRTQGVSLANCRQGYEEDLQDGISAGMMCSGGDSEATSCRWKFGTPLVVKGVSSSNSSETPSLKQVGLFSWGSEALLPACEYGPENPKPMVYTRVSAYFQWIQRLINVPRPLNQIQ